jgi:peptidoglycan-associated lipoprotein
LAVAGLAGGCAKKPLPPAQAEARVVPAPEPPRTVEPDRKEADARARIQALLAEVFKPVYFPYDRAELPDEAKAVLAKAGELLKQQPSISVVIQGNTDERGTEEYNLALGQRRAAAVQQYLVGYGIQPSRLTLLSFGEEKPARPGHSEGDWALNRRDEFQVTF